MRLPSPYHEILADLTAGATSADALLVLSDERACTPGHFVLAHFDIRARGLVTACDGTREG